jgi:nucleoside 2-deoxyribosyltransferase
MEAYQDDETSEAEERFDEMSEDMKKVVYISGPIFCPEEVGSLAEIAELLEKKGYLTYLPHRDGLESCLMETIATPVMEDKGIMPGPQSLYMASFALEVFQLAQRGDCLVFNMNGRVPDEGAVFKTSFAFIAGKPLVLYKRDHRSIFHGRDNAMITGLSPIFSTVGKIKDIPAELAGAIESVEAQGKSPYSGDNIPPFVRQVVEVGREVWSSLNELRFQEVGEGERQHLLALVCEKFKASQAVRRLGWT